MNTASGACWSSTAPSQAVLSNYQAIFAHMWVCCQTPRLLRKLQCEKELHQHKQRCIVFCSGPQNHYLCIVSNVLMPGWDSLYPVTTFCYKLELEIKVIKTRKAKTLFLKSTKVKLEQPDLFLQSWRCFASDPKAWRSITLLSDGQEAAQTLFFKKLAVSSSTNTSSQQWSNLLTNVKFLNNEGTVCLYCPQSTSSWHHSNHPSCSWRRIMVKDGLLCKKLLQKRKESSSRKEKKI